MKLPSFGKKIVGWDIDGTDWKLSYRKYPGIALSHEVGIYWSDGTYEKNPLQEWLSKGEVEDMAKALGLIPSLAKPKATRHRKAVCSYGCKLTPENTIVLNSGLRRCRKHYLAYNAKRNADRRAKRAAAKGGQK